MHSDKVSVTQTQSLLAPLFIFVVALLFSSYFYSLGLDGPFILDDAPNLDALSTVNSGETSVVDFVNEGRAGPTGRPVALYSFASQASSWPDHPLNFKIYNVALHLLNALLVFMLVYQLGMARQEQRSHAYLVAGIAAAFWAIHPIHVSTVLYVVQRMNLLSAFFLLFALNIYMNYRLTVVGGHGGALSWQKCLSVALALIIGGGLSVFSKENGVLLVFYVWVIEYFVFGWRSGGKSWHACRLLVIVLPVLLVIGYLIYIVLGQLNHGGDRSFNLIERLLTESRILWIYIAKILVPLPSGYGLISDDLLISKSLLQPITTLLALLSWLVAIIFAIVKRRSLGIISFTVFWYLAGHVLESTVIPLELYFEHRNYLPSIALVYLVASGTLSLIQKFRLKSITVLVSVACFTYFAQHAVVMHRVASAWSSPEQQAIDWYNEHPNSIRANEYLFGAYMNTGAYDKALSMTERMIELRSDAAIDVIRRIQIACFDTHYPPELLQSSLDLLMGKEVSDWSVKELKTIILRRNFGQCPNIDDDAMARLAAVLESNFRQQKNKIAGHTLYFELGQYYCKKGETDTCLAMWDRSFEFKNDPGVSYFQATELFRRGRYDEAKNYIQIARQALVVSFPGYSQKLQMLEQLEADMERVENNK